MLITLLVLVALLLGGVLGWALATLRAGRTAAGSAAARSAETAAFLFRVNRARANISKASAIAKNSSKFSDHTDGEKPTSPSFHAPQNTNA